MNSSNNNMFDKTKTPNNSFLDNNIDNSLSLRINNDPVFYISKKNRNTNLYNNWSYNIKEYTKCISQIILDICNNPAIEFKGIAFEKESSNSYYYHAQGNNKLTYDFIDKILEEYKIAKVVGLYKNNPNEPLVFTIAEKLLVITFNLKTSININVIEEEFEINNFIYISEVKTTGAVEFLSTMTDCKPQNIIDELFEDVNQNNLLKDGNSETFCDDSQNILINDDKSKSSCESKKLLYALFDSLLNEKMEEDSANVFNNTTEITPQFL